MSDHPIDIDPLSRQLSRFDPRARGALQECAGSHPRVAQLTLSFPVLFYALATGYGPKHARRTVLQLAIEGRPISEMATALGLPLCFRRLPPEACRGPLIEVAWSEDASRRFGSVIPREMARAATWLKAVSLAALACDEPFAQWFAAQDVFRGKALEVEKAARALAVFAWHSQHAQDDDILRPAALWTPDLGLETALARLAVWLVQHRRLYQQVRHQPTEPGIMLGWSPSPTFDGYEFVPLVTQADLDLEADAMSNCVDGYLARIERGNLKLFSLRRDGQRLATVQVGPDGTKQTLAIHEIKESDNACCSPQLRQVAERWVRSAPLPPAFAALPPRPKVMLPPLGPRAEETWFRQRLTRYQKAKPFVKDVRGRAISLWSLKSGTRAAYHCAALTCHDGLYFVSSAAFRGVPVVKATAPRAASKAANFLRL